MLTDSAILPFCLSICSHLLIQGHIRIHAKSSQSMRKFEGLLCKAKDAIIFVVPRTDVTLALYDMAGRCAAMMEESIAGQKCDLRSKLWGCRDKKCELPRS